ncbi:SLAP domain-containing protein [Lactobacillus sp. ESL0228]|uniref:SLAP domain-containing protein n=1 Tax=Lactobacillus sp. ESL0228 TaxID=2069352 RepID=UPI000EFDA3A3|nr:SLAP domain-containing protein [Lactobacillus sp. ESL0228]RMC47614.1 hypothetical protein F5ESL0228_06740 [Lactobacillus sp. ESL0228]
MKNTTFKKVILTTVVSVGLATPLIASNTNIVPFGQTAIVEAAAKKITLKHNAYLYNYIGHRIGRQKLYRHHSYRYYSVKYIHGKKYYRVGKNRYVKASNVAKMHSYKVKKGSNTTSLTNSSSTTKINTNGMGTPKFQVKIDNNNIDIYSASHAIPHGSWINSIPLHGTYNVYAEENDMYEIGKDQWVNEIDTDSIVQSTNSTSNSSQNNIRNSSSTSTKKTNGKNPTSLTSGQKQTYIERFVEMVNRDREALGRKPLTLNGELSQEAYQRSIHDGMSLVKTGREDHHVDENGNDLMPDDSNAEVCTMLSNEDDIPSFAYNQFMKNDAGANWEHKEILLSSDYSEIGVGIFIGNGSSTYTYGSLVAELR